LGEHRWGGWDVHQQIRSRIKVFEGSEGEDGPAPEGSLERLLELVKPNHNLCIAGFSPIDPETFVVAVDHADTPNDDETEKCLAAIQAEFEAELVDMEGDWTYLRNEKGALLKALRRLQAGGAREVLVGGTANRQFLVHVRR
jgi:hypothetical protein